MRRKLSYLQGVPPGPVNDAFKAWAKRLVDDINGQPDYIASLPVYADDTAAAAGGLQVGLGYREPSGTVRWRAA